MKLICLLTTLLTFQLSAQQSLDVFKSLVDQTWSAEGKWGDGSKFKQEVTFNYDLNGTIVVAKSNGYTNEERTEFGPRNHGIRKVNTTTGEIEFWEFDTFGGLTKGTVSVKGNDLYYQYEYGGMTLTDGWEYVDPFIYRYRVGEFVDGKWKQTFLDTNFVSNKKK